MCIYVCSYCFVDIFAQPGTHPHTQIYKTNTCIQRQKYTQPHTHNTLTAREKDNMQTDAVLLCVTMTWSIVIRKLRDPPQNGENHQSDVMEETRHHSTLIGTAHSKHNTLAAVCNCVLERKGECLLHAHSLRCFCRWKNIYTGQGPTSTTTTRYPYKLLG